MTKLVLALVFLVMLSSCGKKTNSDNVSTKRGINSISNLTGPITAPDPDASIGSDFNVTSTDDGGRSKIFTVATQLEYNLMDYKNRIFYTGLRNAAQYLNQMSDGESVTLQLNADNTYSIEGNPTVPYTGAKQTCDICGPSSAYKCIKDIKRYMDQTGQTSVKGTITITPGVVGLCMTVVYWYAKVLPPSAPTTTGNGGTVFETFAPAHTYADARFRAFIRQVQSWAISDSNPYGTADQPSAWSRQELLDYVQLFDNDPANGYLILTKNDKFQVQLAHYVYHDMPEGFH